MGYSFTEQEFDGILSRLGALYRLVGPVCVKGQAEFSRKDYIGYGEFLSLHDLVLDQKSWFSPKEYLFPVRETLLTFENDTATAPPIPDKPIIIFVRPCDIAGIDRLDRLFLKNGAAADFYYARRRNMVRIFLIECTEGFDSCFCVSMQTNVTSNYSVALRFSKERIQAHVADLDVAEYFSLGKHDLFVPEFVQENKNSVTVPPIEALTPALFENVFWDEYSRRCIACGRCNTSCPTCSCFTTQDTTRDGETIRRRRWAGCHVDGFTDMAGGHAFRKKNGDRMRFKTMHKINDFHRRFGVHQCVGCGRCDDVCPEYISFSNCINKLSRVIKE